MKQKNKRKSPNNKIKTQEQKWLHRYSGILEIA